MRDILNLTKNIYYQQLILVAMIVLGISLHFLFLGKDLAVFQDLANQTDLTFQEYMVGILAGLVQGTVIPVAYSLYLTYALAKSYYSKLARALWGILIITSALLTFFSSSQITYLLILSIVCHLILFINNARIKEKGDSHEIS